MPNPNISRTNSSNQMQLTILSAEAVKPQLGVKANLAVSCNISELPNYHCNLVFTRKHQDLGPIGFLKFESKRPLASGLISLKDNDFDEIFELVKNSPPRNASIFLYTKNYIENEIINNSMSGRESNVEINDLSWRYPII
ncbi:MAG: hypothetical protein VW124_20165 [Paracoccaceae bacterium]|jgi:hypothetical protein